MARATTTRKRSTTTARKPGTNPPKATAPIATGRDPAAGCDGAPDPAAAQGADAATPKIRAELRKPDLIDRVVDTSGLKKKDVKPVVEAMLAVLGQALSDGHVLNVQPLGKVIVNKTTAKENGEVLSVRIRRSRQSAEHGVKQAKTPLAEPGEDR